MSNHKVLVINPYPIDANVPIGIMMGNLFKKFDSDKVLQYYTQQCEIKSTTKFESKLVDITPRSINKIKKKIKLLLQNKSFITTQEESDIKLRSTGIRSSSWRLWLDLLMPTVVEKKMSDEIDMFKPDVIYTQVYSYGMLKFILKISNRFSCPIVIHTLDDWMGSHHKKGIISYIPTMFFENKLKKILNNGRFHMVASPKMEKYMENKYGGKYIFVMNSSKYQEVDIKPRKKNVLKVVYTGGLMLERFIALDEIAKTIDGINKNEIKFEMHIYAPKSHIKNYRDKMQNTIIFHDSVEHYQVHNVLKKSDVLIHAESFNPNVIKFTKYSLSTKIPEYLSSAKPLVYYGPQNIGVAEFLSSKKIGICTDSIKDVEKNLLRLYEDKNFYELLARDGYIKGKQTLDTDVMIKSFMYSLEN